ncbi:hypothetical protein FGADI_785 [Fusarium gaditjirri]|uniref:Cytochrome P450 n=1 Tax=Fusarium gaditjirri TaxID=282569 RepID=A0A8H4X4H4_9HYPO|nr:hypothetical protein FGADI_785 [Fusarium gaditjirri]
MMLYLSIGALALLFAWNLTSLYANYLSARKLGIPIIILPVSFDQPVLSLLMPYLSWVEKLPLGLGRWYRYADVGWPTRDGNRTILEVGNETFVLISPSSILIMTAYPPAVNHVYRDRNLIVPSPFKDFLKALGPHLSSVNGDVWTRHKRVTAQAFVEGNNRFMWDNTIEGVKDLLSTHVMPNEGQKAVWTLTTARERLEYLALHVLVGVGFGQKSTAEVQSGHQRSLLSCLTVLLSHIFAISFLDKVPLPYFILPSMLRKVKLNVAEFILYMKEAVGSQLEKQLKSRAPSKSKKDKVSLVEALVASNEAAKERGEGMHLSDPELYGNLFLFNLAGFETTAGNLLYSMTFLGAYPAFQSWLTEEIDAHYIAGASSYDNTYPKLVRCLAFMHETLRHCGPAPMMLRSPCVATSIPTSPTTSMVVPPGAWISGHFYGVHLSPRWGPDAEEFNPKRFVRSTNDETVGDGKQQKQQEKLATPPGDAVYMAWALGHRACPGKKFSQVEFVAAVAHLLSLYRIELVRSSAAESLEEARKRFLDVIAEKYFVIGARVKRPDDISIRLVPREDKKEVLDISWDMSALASIR